MARCGYCGKHKGKRSCPVLTAICSRCCGEHRRREIDCPPSCQYLTPALPAAPPQDERALPSAIRKLLNFSMGLHEKGVAGARDAWFAGSERTLAEWEASSFLGYLAYGHPGEHGDRAIDRFLREPSRDLSPTEEEALRCVQQRAWVSLFEILAVSRDVGLDLLDRVTGQRLFVREKSGTHGASEGDYLLGWVVALPDHAELTGTPTCTPPPPTSTRSSCAPASGSSTGRWRARGHASGPGSSAARPRGAGSARPRMSTICPGTSTSRA